MAQSGCSSSSRHPVWVWFTFVGVSDWLTSEAVCSLGNCGSLIFSCTCMCTSKVDSIVLAGSCLYTCIYIVHAAEELFLLTLYMYCTCMCVHTSIRVHVPQCSCE